MEIVDIDQLFEEYVDANMFQYTSDPKFNHSSFQKPVGFVKTPLVDETDIFTFEPILDRDAESAWHKALPTYEHIPELALPDDSSPGSIDLEGSESWIDFNFSSFEGLLDRDRNQLRCVSQPCTPRSRPSRSLKKALSFNDRSFIHKSPRPSRKSSVEPIVRMRQASYYRPGVPNIKPVNTDPAESLYIPACSNAMTSLPSASTINRTENGRGSFPQNHQPYPNIYPAFHNELHANDADYLSRQSMPQTPHAAEAWRNRENYSGENWNMAYSVPESSAALSALHTPPSSLSLPATRWGFDTSPKSEFAFSALSNYPVAVPMANSWDGDPARHYSYRESRSPRTGQNIGSAREVINGLGISSSAMYYGDVELVETETEIGEETPRVSASPCEIESFSALQTTPQQQQQALPLGRYSPPRSPSPYPQPQFHRRRSSSHVHSSHRNRRQSSSSSLLQWKQLDSNNANMSFVNFTPEDKKKILTGVAPSGSSKTKARREKEAADKRRKLSQAAVKAVIEAGGDIGSLKTLESEGLLV